MLVNVFLSLSIVLCTVLGSITSNGRTQFVAVSIKGDRNKDLLNIAERFDSDKIIQHVSSDSRLLVFHFDSFELSNALDEFNSLANDHQIQYPYLTKLIESSDWKASGSDLVNSLSHRQVHTVEELSADNVTSLENISTASHNDVILIKFDGKDYDLQELEFVLQEASAIFDSHSIVLQYPKSHTLVQERDNVPNDAGDDNNNDENPSTEDPDTLSNLWTVGLLTCLLISILLLFILLVALSWITSLDTSYGALEKSTNPLKKNN